MLLKRTKKYFGVEWIRTKRLEYGFWCCMHSKVCRLWSESDGHVLCSKYKVPTIRRKLYNVCCIVNKRVSSYIYVPNVD